MKVIHLVSGLAGGGAEQLIAGLCKQSSEDADIQMEVVSMSYINEIGWKMQEFVVFPVDFNNSKNSRNKFISSLRAIAFLIRRKPQVIHAHLFYACMAACIVKLFRPRTKIVFTLHNSFQPNFFYRTLLFLTCPLRNADITFPNLPQLWYQKKNPAIIPNGIDIAAYSKAGVAKNPVFTFLFAGRLHPQKSPITLVEVAKNLKGTFQFKILVAGTGPLLQKLKEEAHQSGTDQHFEFAGYQNDMAQVLASSHCLILPSVYEGMPLIIMEAAAAGIPVVITDAAAKSLDINDELAYIPKVDEFPQTVRLVLSDYSNALLKAAKLRSHLSQYPLSRSYHTHLQVYRAVI